ncbi:protein archease [Candidatus Pacearchaeota archaeon ex4484_71]|nr:MAG: protein archease [Candidatus Pacearchaeota archaeon ex4484_71]
MKKYEFLEHTADVKFIAYGKDLRKLMINSAKALKKVIYNKRVKKREEKKIKIKGKDLENMVYLFLEEFLFLLDGKNFLFSKIKEIEVDEKNFSIKATILGDSSKRYDIQSDVKAITYNEMYVRKEGKLWISQVVLDV